MHKKPTGRKPGRPRKNRISPPEPRHGVVARPVNDNMHIEFMYDRPIVFKKLWSYYKAMAVEKLQFVFTADSILICGEDHHRKSKMRTKINTNNVNHYYCAGTLDIGIMCADLEKIMSTIDRSCGSIFIMSRKGYTQKNILFTFVNNDMEIEKKHVVELIGEYTQFEDFPQELYADPKIKFRLPGQYFKKMITNIRGFAGKMTIIQEGSDHPLVFEYETDDTKIKSTELMRSNSSIMLTSNLGETETFRISVKLDYIKPISATFLSENIWIYAHEQRPLLFTINIDDGAVEVDIVTNIINLDI